MALINCVNCGNKISDKAQNCVHCGYANLKKVCSECNSVIDYSIESCPECGAIFSKIKKKDTFLRVSYKSFIISIFIVVIIASGIIFFIDYYNYLKQREKIIISNSEIILPPPPVIEFKVTPNNKKIRSLLNFENITGSKKQLINSCDYKNPYVRNYALKIVGNNPGNFNLGQICDIFDNIFGQWKYVNDPVTRNFEKEYVAKASETINNGFHGDCDDFAVTIAALILSIGGEARVSYAYNYESGHAFTEVNIGKTDIHLLTDYISKRYYGIYEGSINYRIDNIGNKWLNLDWFSKYPGGKYFNYSHGTYFYILQNYCEDF